MKVNVYYEQSKLVNGFLFPTVWTTVVSFPRANNTMFWSLTKPTQRQLRVMKKKATLWFREYGKYSNNSVSGDDYESNS